MTFERKRGDDYPLIGYYRMGGVLTDVSGATSLTFSYEDEAGSVRSIEGTQIEIGVVEFIPESGADFITKGVYTYDMQRVQDGYTYTHDDGFLHITKDVTP